MLALGDGFVLLPGALTEGLSGVAGSSLVFFRLALGETIDFHLYCAPPFPEALPDIWSCQEVLPWWWSKAFTPGQASPWTPPTAPGHVSGE